MDCLYLTLKKKKKKVWVIYCSYIMLILMKFKLEL